MVEELREDVRELRAEQVMIKINVAVLMRWMDETQARNRSLPGWLLAAAGLLLPLIGSIATMWLAGKIP